MEQFIKLNHTSNIRLPLTSWAKSTTHWLHKAAFDLAIVPPGLITEEPLKELMRQFQGTPVVFRMQPWQFYRFHTDAARSCAINMLLEGTDSQTYYGEETQDEEVLDIVELVTRYLASVREHGVREQRLVQDHNQHLHGG